MDEKVFFEGGDIKVTNARFISGGQTYAMSNVTSVMSREESPNALGPLLVIAVGLIVFFTESYLLGAAITALGGYWIWHQDSTYHVVLSTSAGETTALTSQKKALVGDVVRALNDAIVHRG